MTDSNLLYVPGFKLPIDITHKVNGCKYFTWSEALHGGERIPVDSVVTANIVRAAQAFDRAREALGKPMIVTSWYRDPESNAAAGGVSNSEHLTGEAMDFYCEGMWGDEMYSTLDPIWNGGLGWYPDRCHIDIGANRRW